MAIYGVGASYDGTDDVSGRFIENNLVGVGWGADDAPELQQYFRSLRVGDIVYIKSAAFGKPITVKAIGVVADDAIRDTSNSRGLVTCGRNVVWIDTTRFVIPRPREKNNVRGNTVYEVFHADVQREIIGRIGRQLRR
jgi:hypothetical protein